METMSHIYTGDDRAMHDIQGLIKREIQMAKCARSASGPAERSPSTDTEYPMNHRYRGLAIVISNGQFLSDQNDPKGISPRDYSRVEIETMDTAFSRLGFYVIKFENLRCLQMIDVLRVASDMDDFHRDADAFACVIGSHGGEISEKNTSSHKTMVEKYHHVIFGSDGFYVQTEDLMCNFDDIHSSALRGKPRMFFIQACRGRSDFSTIDSGILVNVQGQSSQCKPKFTDDNGTKRMDEQEDMVSFFRKLFRKKKQMPIACPNHFLVMYSTASGKKSMGRGSVGGWMTSQFSSVIKEHSDDTVIDLIDILSHVASGVAKMESKTNDRSTTGLKAAMCFEHRLTKEIVLRDLYHNVHS